MKVRGRQGLGEGLGGHGEESGLYCVSRELPDSFRQRSDISMHFSRTAVYSVETGLQNEWKEAGGPGSRAGEKRWWPGDKTADGVDMESEGERGVTSDPGSSPA